MGRATWQPKWWTPEQHESGWERVKEAMRRDWEQTKHDFRRTSGRELGQDVDDTVKQAMGSEPIPPITQPNWDDVEVSFRYGYGARQQFGSRFARWDEDLERELSGDWDERAAGRTWTDAREYVRRGFEHRGP